jgi:K+-transporting ATPase ATPase C chain
MDASAVEQLVDQHTKGRLLGVLGEPTVNVVELNLALDAAAGGAPKQQPAAVSQQP